jgi:hypothetical protein
MRAFSLLLLPTASSAFSTSRFRRMASRILGVSRGVTAADVLKAPQWPEVLCGGHPYVPELASSVVIRLALSQFRRLFFTLFPWLLLISSLSLSLSLA